MRALGIMDDRPSKFAPNVGTLESQGYKLYAGVSNGISAPGGTPIEIANLLSRSIKKVLDTDEARTKTEQINYEQRYMDAAEYGAFWDRTEAEMRPLMELAKEK